MVWLDSSLLLFLLLIVVLLVRSLLILNDRTYTDNYVLNKQYKRRQKNEGRRQKFTRRTEVLNPSQSLFPLKSEVLDRREKDEVNKPSARDAGCIPRPVLCPLPSALRAKPDNSIHVFIYQDTNSCLW